MLKDKIRKFMSGRHGNDDLSLALLIFAGICLALAALSRNKTAASVFVLILILLVAWDVFRMFSKDLNARERENEQYKRIAGILGTSTKPFRDSMKKWWGNVKGIKLFKNNKTYGLKVCLFKCPGCGVDVKIPANKGKILVICPKCGAKFERMS